MAADDDTTTAPPPPQQPQGGLLGIDDPQLQRLIQQFMPQPVQVDQTPVARGLLSRIGEALGGGSQVPMSPADQESAGLRSLIGFGTGLMRASEYRPGATWAGNLARGLEGGQRAMLGSEELSASTLGAQQSYQQQLAQDRLGAIKTALPLLMQSRMMNQPNPLAGTTTGAATAGRPAVDAPWAANRDDFVQKFTPVAQAISAQTGLPADYVLSQAGLETGWGSSSAARNNNFFGITDPKTGKPASYATPQDGINAYTTLMSSDRYKDVPRTGTPAEIGDRMAIAGYNPNVPKKDSTDSYGVRVGNFAASLPKPGGPPGGATTAGAPPAAQPAAMPPPAAVARPPIVTDQPAGGGTVAGPAGTANVGAPAPPSPAVRPDVNAIIAGMTGAGAKPTTLAPGPSTQAPQAPPPTTVAANTQPVPQPVPTTPNAPPAAQPATQQPTDTRPDVELTLPQFLQRHATPPTFESVPVAPGAQAAADQAVANAQAVRQTAALNLQDARLRGDTAGENKAAEAYRSAGADLTTALQNQNKLTQDAATATASNKQKAAEDQNTRLAAAYKDIQDRAAAAAIETQKGQQAIDLAKVTGGQHWRETMAENDAKTGTEQLGKLDDAATGSANMQSILALVGPQMKNLPTGLVAQTLADHPEMVNYLRAAHLLDGPTADATQLLQGLTAFMATEMKPKGLGPLRVQEMNAFQGSLPTLLQSAEGRQKAFAFINAYSQRIQQEADFAHNYFKRPVANEAPDAKPGTQMPARNLDGLWGAMGKTPEEGGLGSVLPTYTGGTSTAQDAQNYKTWEQQQQSQPGHPYWQLRKNPTTGLREMNLAITPPAGG